MHPSGCGRSGGRVVEGARLESEYTAKPYRGFESLPLRQPAAKLVAPTPVPYARPAESEPIPPGRRTLENAATPFETGKRKTDLLKWEDKKKFQKIFEAQAVRSYLYLSFGMGA